MNGFIRYAIVSAMIASLLSCTSQPVDDDLSLDGNGETYTDTSALEEAATDNAGAAQDSAPADEFADFESENQQQQQAQEAVHGDQDLALEDEFNEANDGAPAAKQEQAATPPPPPVAEEITEDPFAETPVAEAPAPEPEPVPAPEVQEPVPPVAVETEPEPAPPAPEPVAPAAAPVRITDLKFKANDNGGTIIVQATQPLTYSTRSNPDLHQFIIEVDNAILPDKLKRSLNTRDIKGAVGAIDAYQNPGSTTARFVIQMRDGVGEPAVQQEGNSLLIVAGGTGSSSSETVAEAAAPEEAAGGSDVVTDRILPSSTLTEFLVGNTKFYGKKISIETNNMDIRDALNFITEESGVNMVIAEEVRGNISLKLRQVPWDQALVMIMRAKKLGYTRQGNVLRIAPVQDLKAEEDDATKLALARKNVEPLKVRMFPVSYAKVDELEKKIKDFLGERGKVVGDTRTNALVVTDIEENLERAAKLIKSLDIQPAQVLIEGKIVEAGESFQRKVGVSWGATGVPLSLGNGSRGPVNMTPSFNVNPGAGSGGSNFNFNLNVGTLDIFGNITAALALSEQEEQVKVISSPRILAMSNEQANINQTTEVPVRQVTVNGGVSTETFQFKPLSLKLEVTPQVTADGSVIMKVGVMRQFKGADQGTGQNVTFPVNSREANTRVLVKNGQTAVIGGIYQSDATDAETGVPWFREIPVIGNLFKTSTVGKQKMELLIFLTPRILGQVDSNGNGTPNTKDF
ncbi:type IV pilus secretin PilQ [Bdellovibrio sp. HCB2-146]|uniref:type IV pilus secretin PilQ n=1 Tax=Bdellovibrio sp. HCB2-146 TaxID=3394362 RepID=UPI0039BC4980